MPDLFDLIARWWKKMLVVILLSLLAVGVITFLKPRQYLSVATALPVSSVLSDKAKIFNENIQYLYSTLSSADELDRVIGTANLDTLYLAVGQQFNLSDHYKIKGETDDILARSAAKLKANTKVLKSEFGELKVKVWDTDKNLAPQLANALMEKLNAIHQSLQNKNNVAALENIKRSREKMVTELDSLRYDSANSILRSTAVSTKDFRASAVRRNSLLLQLEQYEKLINEYQLMVDSKNPVLAVVENARAGRSPDRPKRMQIMISTAVLSLLFALLAALIMERRKNA